MRAAHPIAGFFASCALVCALTAFILGSGPLSAALGLAVLALLIVPLTGILGAPRRSLAAAYWACAALLAVPLANASSLQLDDALVVLGCGGLVSSAWLYFGRARSGPGAL